MNKVRASITLAFILLICLPVVFRPALFLSDDCFFYIQIARKIVSGAGVTFNGLYPTNGFHPLWMVVCVVLDIAVRSDKEALLWGVGATATALLVVSAALLSRLVDRLSLGEGWIGAILLILMLGASATGSEAHLTLLIAVILLSRLALRPPSNISDHAIIGVLLGLMMLSRLDTVFHAGALCLWLFLRNQGTPFTGRSRRHVLVTAIVAGVVVAPYLAWNFHNFGHFNPISGSIKSSLPHVGFRLRNLGAIGFAGLLGSLLTVIFALSGVLPVAARSLMASWAGASVAHALYVVMLTNHDTAWSWYYVPAMINFALLIPFLAQRILASIASNALKTVIVSGILLIVSVPFACHAWVRVFAKYDLMSYPYPHLVVSLPEDVMSRLIAQDLARRLPPGAVLAVFGAPGRPAYYLDHPVLAMDGLTDDFVFDKELLNEGSSYFERHGICYFLIETHGMQKNRQIMVAPYSHRVVATLDLSKLTLVANYAALSPRAGTSLYRSQCPDPHLPNIQ